MKISAGVVKIIIDDTYVVTGSIRSYNLNWDPKRPGKQGDMEINIAVGKVENYEVSQATGADDCSCGNKHGGTHTSWCEVTKLKAKQKKVVRF